ncbi:hypothetical protein EV183_000051, partial [Coemansia sp. RSA 2336]
YQWSRVAVRTPGRVSTLSRPSAQPGPAASRPLLRACHRPQSPPPQLDARYKQPPAGSLPSRPASTPAPWKLMVDARAPRKARRSVHRASGLHSQTTRLSDTQSYCPLTPARQTGLSPSPAPYSTGLGPGPRRECVSIDYNSPGGFGLELFPLHSP